MQLKWKQTLSSVKLCTKFDPYPCTATHMVNAAGISDDGTRAVSGTYYFQYRGLDRVRVDGLFGLYVHDTATASLLIKHEFNGDQGIYTVAMSGDGAVAAGGGLVADDTPGPPGGMLIAFDVDSRARLINVTDFPGRVTSIALSRDGAVLAGTSENQFRIYQRKAGVPYSAPTIVKTDARCEMVTVSAGGRWAAAADVAGTIYVAPIEDGIVGPPVRWTAGPTQFHAIAAARSTDMLVAGGDRQVFLLGWRQGTVDLAAEFTAAMEREIRWVAIADDASFVTASLTDTRNAGSDNALLKLRPQGAALVEEWHRQLAHPPNSTSIDGQGELITVATGFPNGTGGSFTLFDRNGTQIANHETADMNWPMWISRNGKGIISGTDKDSELFFFTP